MAGLVDWITGNTYDPCDPGSRDPARVEAAHGYLAPLVRAWFRPRIRGLEDVPAGPCLFVGNHNAAMLMPEMYVLGIALYERFGLAGLPFGLGHSLGLRLPLVNQSLVPLGALKGTQKIGERLLRSGHRVLVYPGGELDSMRAWGDRDRVVFGDRRGYVKLALRVGIPVVPVVTCGAHETLRVLDDGRRLAQWLGLSRRIGLKAWPVVLCLPWGLWFGVPPPHIPWPSRIFQEIVPPLRFERTGEDAACDPAYVEHCHRRIHGVMEDTLRRLSAERRDAMRGKGSGR